MIALGGGAVGTDQIRTQLRQRALTILVEIEPRRRGAVRGSDRPLAQDEAAFRTLYDQRRPLYDDASDARTRDLDGGVLVAGGVHVETGSLERLGARSAATARSSWSATRASPGSTAWTRSSRSARGR